MADGGGPVVVGGLGVVVGVSSSQDLSLMM